MTAPRGLHLTRIREVLKANPDGLLVSEIAEAVGISSPHVWRQLKKPDVTWAYIDRWDVVAHSSGWCAVFCYAAPPDNCPEPTKSPTAAWKKKVAA